MANKQACISEKEFRSHFVELQQYFLTLTMVLRDSYKIIERRQYDAPFPPSWDKSNAIIIENFNNDESYKHNGRAFLGPYKSLESSIKALKLKVDALPIDKSESMDEMAFFSTFMCIYCWGLSLTELPIQGSYIYTTDDYGHVIIKKSYELLGYWTARLEVGRRNKDAVSVRTVKKEEKKTKIRAMMDDYNPADKKTLQKLLRKVMMSNIGGTETNMRNLIKEIVNEDLK